MYTLRTFKNVNETDRTQIYLGDNYTVNGACEEDKKVGVKLWVHSNQSQHTQEGIAIYEDVHAFIMNAIGGTFETLNRPKRERPIEIQN